MKKRLILSTLLVILSSILAANAFASNTYSYSQNISAGSPVTTLLTENNSNEKIWTLYPNLTIDNGSLAVSGAGVSVDYANSSSYAGYFYQDTDGNIYQFSGCAYSTPSSGKKVLGGAIDVGSYTECFDRNGLLDIYSDLRVSSGKLVCYNVYDGSANNRREYFTASNGNVYEWSYMSCSTGEWLYFGYRVTCAGDDTYEWNFRAVATCRVTFDPQSGSVSPTKSSAIYNYTYGTLPTPLRAGYTFTGWYTGVGGSGTKISSTSTVTSDTTLYAAWTINQYTVSFESNGGSSVASVKQDYNTAVSKPADPARTGYTFGGWYADSELKSAATWPITIGVSDMTLYAAWTINQYMVSFESNEGSAVAAITQDYGTTVDEPATPMRTGYTFAGWYADSGLTSPVAWPLTIGAGDITLYAAWTINQYVVSFESNGGSSIAAVTQDYNTAVAKPTDPTRTGYTFGGWYADSELMNAVTWPIRIGDGDITVYAAWSANSYTVSFESNGGSSVASVEQDYNTAVAKPADPTRTGYTFSGWYTDSELTSAVTWPLTIGAEDVTLYAKWTINPYRVIFESNGGSLVAAIAQAYGTTVVEPTPPTRTGYAFAGWYADSALKKAVTWPLTIGACDTTLYAAWRAIPYTICFESNGGSSVSSITQGYGTTVAEPEKPTRSGYTFAGWYSDSELKKAVSWPLTVAEGNITLYAAWTMDQISGPGEITPVPNYTVSFDSNDGSTVVSRTILSGDQLTEPAAPSKPGYTFEGWYKDSACTIPWDFSEKITKNVTLYAKWSADISNTKYTVSFESNGAIIGEQTVSHGKTVRMPSEPKRKGYDFAGWFKNKSLKDPWIFSDDVVTNSITLYAKWVAVEAKDDDKPITGSQKDNDKPTTRPQKGNNKTPVINTSSGDKDNENLDPQPNKSKDDRDKELEITGGRRESKAETTLATDNGADPYSLKDILLFSGAVIAAILLLIFFVCLIFSKVRSKSKKEVYFYENNSMICSAKIRRDKVDITKAISEAAGPKLKVKINDEYAEKAFGRDVYFYFKGKAIGTMTIDCGNSFEIAIS